MKRFFVRILDNIRARKSLFLYSTICLILSISLLAMIIGAYSQHDENVLLAEKNDQIAVFDLTTGEEVEASAILHNNPKVVPVKPEETAAKPVEPAPPIKQADVMFIIGNLGLNKTDTDKAIALPAEFILSFTPYAELGLELSKSSYDKGHVTLADLPMQLSDGSETGNLALTVENGDFKNARNLDAILSKTYQASGVLTPPNDIFSHSENFKPILQEIARRKLFVAYAGEGESIDTAAHDNEVELLKIDIVLEENEALGQQLANVESMVAKSGLIVVMIKSPSAESIDIISKWADTLATKHIRLIAPNK